MATFHKRIDGSPSDAASPPTKNARASASWEHSTHPSLFSMLHSWSPVRNAQQVGRTDSHFNSKIYVALVSDHVHATCPLNVVQAIAATCRKYSQLSRCGYRDKEDPPGNEMRWVVPVQHMEVDKLHKRLALNL